MRSGKKSAKAGPTSAQPWIQNVGRRRLRELVNNFSSFVFGKGEVGQLSDISKSLDLE